MNKRNIRNTAIIGGSIWYALRRTGNDKAVMDEIRYHIITIKGEIDRRRANYKAQKDIAE